MKIKISIIVSFLFSITICYGQSANQLNNLLNASVKKYLEGQEQFGKEHLNKVVFLKENFPSDFQFSKTVFENYGITFFYEEEYNKSDLKQGVKAYRLLPIILKDDTLSITIASISVFKKRNNTTISSSNYFIYSYKYSCEVKKWILLDVREKGI